MGDRLRPLLALAILRSRKVAAALRNPLALRLGVAPSIEHKAFLKQGRFDFIVDVGANRGQFLLAAAEIHPQASILCYEPLSGPFRVLQRLASAYPADRVICSQLALSDETGEGRMFVTRDDDSSSLLLPTAEQRRISRGSVVAALELVKLDRLDAQSEVLSRLSKRSLLKIDVQGSELAVLKGAEGCLAIFDSVYVECSFVNLYDGQPSASDVQAYLEAHGFQLVATHNELRRSGELIQADLHFSRSTFASA